MPSPSRPIEYEYLALNSRSFEPAPPAWQVMVSDLRSEVRVSDLRSEDPRQARACRDPPFDTAPQLQVHLEQALDAHCQVLVVDELLRQPLE
jgi:hypothetical protein